MLPGRARRSLAPHRGYHDDLIEVLRSASRSGDLAEHDVAELLAAAEGRKARKEQRDLAAKVQQTFLEDVELPSLARTLAGAADAQVRKYLMARVLDRLPDASLPELIRGRALAEDADLHRAIARELGQRDPKYAEVHDELADLWRLAGSEDRRTSEAAREQVARAFQRAPISECLRWLGGRDAELNGLIWKQIDRRIVRADARRRAGYRDVALAAVAHDRFNTASKRAALALLGRLEDPRAVEPLVRRLPSMAEQLWPQAGGTLRGLSGEDFGPHEGDGAVEVFTAVKRWRAWLKERGDP